MQRRMPLVLFLLSFALPAAAQFSIKEIEAAAKDPKAYTIDEPTVQVVAIATTALLDDATPPPAAEGDPLVIADHIMNIGAKAWQFMLDNQAVAFSTTQYATALPEGVAHWSSMAGWSAPKGTLYALTAKNGYGRTVVNIRYMVVRTSGGSYEGRGKYLTAVSAQTMPMSGAWGYHVSLEASAPDPGIVNAGSKADPIAAMTFRVGWKIETAIKKSQGAAVYYLRGDGAYQEIGGPFKRGGADKMKAAIAKTMEETLSYGP